MSSHFNDKHLSWCPVYKINGELQHNNYSVVEQGSVEPVLRDNSKDTRIPDSPPNGGIFWWPTKSSTMGKYSSYTIND